MNEKAKWALSRVAASIDNEATAFPVWIIAEYHEGYPGQPVWLAGPYFSRQRAQSYLEAKRYNFKDAFVYCCSGHASQEYRDLYEASNNQLHSMPTEHSQRYQTQEKP